MNVSLPTDFEKDLSTMKKIKEANAIILDKMITITVCKKAVEEARTYFARIGADLTTHFAKLGSILMDLDANQRLKLLHDFYRPRDESSFHFDMKDAMRHGHSFTDYICPDSMEIGKSHFKVGNRYGRTLFLKDYTRSCKAALGKGCTRKARGAIWDKFLLAGNDWLQGVSLANAS